MSNLLIEHMQEHEEKQFFFPKDDILRRHMLPYDSTLNRQAKLGPYANGPVYIDPHKKEPTSSGRDDIDFLLLLSKAVGKFNALTTMPLLVAPRAPITRALGRIHAYATNLHEVLVASMAQCESVELQGRLIEKIKKDPDMIRAEKEFIDEMKKDAEFIKNGKFRKKFKVQFGGSRGDGNGSWTVKGGASVALNELTWIIRNTHVIATAVRNHNRTVTITYTLPPEEKLDLRPNGSEKEYDVIVRIMGYYYHDKYGGNPHMRVKATWTTIIKLNE